MFYCIIVTLTWLVWHIAFRIKVIGRENLIKDRGFILAPNHLSAIDPVFIVISRFWGKKLLVMGKEEIFSIHPILSWMFRSVGVVPVQRGKGDTTVLDNAVQSVKNGQGLLIFAEGTRSKDGNLGKLKSGAFVVADAAKADVIPCRIIYKGGKMKVFGRCTIIFGKPIPAEEFTIDSSHKAASLREKKKLLTEALEQLLEDNRKYL